VRALAEKISRKIAILPRVDFLTFARAKQRETRLCEKKEFFTKKNEKKVVFCKEEENFAFVGFLGGGRDILQKEQIRSKLELGRVWNDDV